MTATVEQWVTVYGHHAGDAIFEDPQGMARVPLRVVPALSHAAAVHGRVSWAGREFDRDVMTAVRRDLLAGPKPFGGLAHLDTCTVDGCEEAGLFDLEDARLRCATHAKADQ